MDDCKERLIQQLEAAISAVRESGENRYICEGLGIAKEIVAAGLDADAKALTSRILGDFGI